MLRYLGPLKLCMRNKILRSTKVKYDYFDFCFYKINGTTVDLFLFCLGMGKSLTVIAKM